MMEQVDIADLKSVGLYARPGSIPGSGNRRSGRDAEYRTGHAASHRSSALTPATVSAEWTTNTTLKTAIKRYGSFESRTALWKHGRAVEGVWLLTS